MARDSASRLWLELGMARDSVSKAMARTRDG